MAEDLKCRHGVTEIRGLNMCHQCPPFPETLPIACCAHVANEKTALRSQVSSLQVEVHRLKDQGKFACELFDHIKALKQSLAEERERVRPLLEAIKNALPCISTAELRWANRKDELIEALNAYEKAGSDHIPDAGKKVGP